jgi:HK97 family phage major capsid protein
LVIERLGATVLRGLSGDLDLPKLTASGTTHWIGENADTTRSAAEFGKVSMKPKTVSAEYRLSRRMQIQPAQSIEQLLRADLGKIIAQAVDAAALAGSGAGAEPEGLLNSITPYVTVSTELCDIASELMSSLEADNVTGGAFCTSSVVLGMARKIKDGEGLSIPIAATFHGQRVEQTTLVPADLGGSNDKSALIWGLWSELMLAYWSGVDIVPNQYHPDVSSNGGLLLHAFLDCDVAVRHSEAFVWSEI